VSLLRCFDTFPTRPKRSSILAGLHGFHELKKVKDRKDLTADRPILKRKDGDLKDKDGNLLLLKIWSNVAVFI
jgi:hypothetical protein